MTKRELLVIARLRSLPSMTTERARLRKVELADLSLERFWLEELHVISGESVETNGAPVKIARPQVLQDAEEARRYQVRLRARFSQAGQQVDATIVGQFLLPADASAGQGQQMIKYNCPSILFGVFRGIVAQLTALTPLGRMDVPSVNLAALSES